MPVIVDQSSIGSSWLSDVASKLADGPIELRRGLLQFAGLISRKKWSIKMARALIQSNPAAWEDVSEDECPAEAVTVQVTHSALNYKDALALRGRAPLFRSFPMVGG